MLDRQRARILSLPLAVAAGAGLAGTARAAPDDRAAAQALFEQARSLVEHGDFADACPKFAESQRLDPGIGTMLWLADCYEGNGQTASAWDEFKEAAAAADARRDPRAKVARQKANALEPRLSRLVIILAPGGSVPELEVRRDGTVVGSAEYNQPVPLDPGVHTLAASAAGRKPWSTTVVLSKGPTRLSVTVPVLEQAAAPPPVTSATPPVESTPFAAAEPQSAGGMGSQRATGLVVAAAGIISLGVGGYFSLKSKSTYDDSNAGSCNPSSNICSQAGLDLRSDARSQALVATILLGTGAAAVIGGALLFFTAPSARQGVTLTPGVGTNGASLRLGGAW